MPKTNKDKPDQAGQTAKDAKVGQTEETQAAKVEKTKPAAKAQAKGEMRPFEEWAKEYGTAPAAQAGLKRLMRWAPGKSVSEADYKAAEDAFSSRRIGGGSGR